MLTLMCFLLAWARLELVLGDVQLDIYLNEVRSLSQLPMDKLIRIKSTFFDQQETLGNNSSTGEDNFKSSSNGSPIALRLRRPNLKGVRRHDDYHHDEKSKSSKVSKIFQLAITTLSFFAFGGYLITLIITALKRNNTGSVIVLQTLQNLKRPKRDTFFHDPRENDFHTEKLYKGMILLSEGYALYNN